MRKYRSFGETNLKYGIFSKTNFQRSGKKKEKKSDGKFPIGLGKGKQKYF
jgi:hypothetical protein